VDWQTTRLSLLERLRDPADVAAWRDFDRRYGDLIVRYGRLRGLQLADAEDVRQVVLLNLSRTMPRFRYSPERGRFRSYLGRVVQHAIWRRRPDGASGRLDMNEDVAAARPALDEAWEQEWVRHHIRMAMEELRRTHEPRALEVFEDLLRGESVVSVAREHGMSVEAVHKIKQRVRDRLKAIIAGRVRQEDGLDG
jgi:RNA polymerase sigma-70 factor (ECF subfamily)